ncbi:4'-phosphopantetheinyl transferase family protein [Candidatus Legionella polyplacis]|uniref:4'-phosphopantetheinyl transferase superfamily protein n=1 Tax=Candidatus Legionella polyplacis TaxID=2005262 RepID=A0ABZ2GVK0_9GAMM
MSYNLFLKTKNNILNNFKLKTDQIDIWEFSYNIIPIKLAKNFLNSQEILKASKFNFDYHKHKFIINRALLKIILSHYLKQNIHKLKLNFNKNGKPFINYKHIQLEFNLSHSYKISLLAIGKKYPIGIDIEFFFKRNFNKIIKKILNFKELTIFNQISEKLKPTIFYKIWTQKEAFIKTFGLKITFPIPYPHSWTIENLINNLKITLKLKNNQFWNIISFSPKKLYNASICYSQNIKTIRYRTIYPQNFYEYFYQINN